MGLLAWQMPMMLIKLVIFQLHTEEDHDFFWILASQTISLHGYYGQRLYSDNYPCWISLNRILQIGPHLGNLIGEETVWLAFGFTSDASTVMKGPFIIDVLLKKNKVIPDAPINISATDGLYQDKIKVTWDAPPGATSYKVYRTNSLTGAKSLVGTTPYTYFFHSPVTYGGYNFYWVQACTEAGCSGFSEADSGFISKDTVGAYDPATSSFRLNYQNVYKGADKSFNSWPGRTEAHRRGLERRRHRHHRLVRHRHRHFLSAQL